MSYVSGERERKRDCGKKREKDLFLGIGSHDCVDWKV